MHEILPEEIYEIYSRKTETTESLLESSLFIFLLMTSS